MTFLHVPAVMVNRPLTRPTGPLTGVASATAAGSGGTGIFRSSHAATSYQSSIALSNAATGTGSVYLAYLDIVPDTDINAIATMTVIVGGVTVWTSTYTLGSFHSVKAVQFSTPSRSDTVIVRFQSAGADFTGTYTIRHQAITSAPYSAYSPSSIVESTDSLYGVIVDGSGNPFYADFNDVHSSVDVWGYP